MPPVSPRASFTVPLAGRAPLELGARTLVMGVVNVTPDSFSDGGTAFDPDAACEQACALVAAGADLLDIGGESTRPGAEALDADEEWRRLEPVLARVVARVSVPISVDTYKAGVASRALDAGAALINDISGLRYDADLASVLAASGAATILMHTRGRSKTMYGEARYHDVFAETLDELRWSLETAAAAGVPPSQVILDPGLGFAKQAAHSLTVLAGIERYATLGRPLLVGPSRKSFLTLATGARPPQARDWATAAAATIAVLGGAHIVRVHHVDGIVQAVRLADAVRDAAGAPPERRGDGQSPPHPRG